MYIVNQKAVEINIIMWLGFSISFMGIKFASTQDVDLEGVFYIF